MKLYVVRHGETIWNVEHKVQGITDIPLTEKGMKEAEELQDNELLKDIPEDEYLNITLDINIKSINTIITSLAKKNLVVKTEPTNISVDGTTRSLRQYYLK